MNYFDIVKFKTNEGIKQGEVRNINNYPNETDYDIYVESENCDYKHIPEEDLEFVKENKQKYIKKVEEHIEFLKKNPENKYLWKIYEKELENVKK